jgi:hypothetical protein
VIGGDTVHIARLLGHAAEKIPATYDQRYFNAEIVNILDLSRDGVNAAGFNPKTFVPGQGFTGELEKNAFVSRHAG